VPPDPAIRARARIVVGYLGIMNDQDDAELFVRMAHRIRVAHRRTDISFVMVGGGTAHARLRSLRDRLGLTDVVEMTGHIPWERVLRVLAATDICVQPDLPDAFTEKSTMNKLMEYMAVGKPIAAFDMTETRASGGRAISYASRNDVEALADVVVELADDTSLRTRLGAAGRNRVERELAWEHQARHLLRAYDAALGGAGSPSMEAR
jgi:glycosyltransferase involved in cell wall biosynthesis